MAIRVPHPSADVFQVPGVPVRFPHIEVQLTGRDGNAYAILAAVSSALRKDGVPKAEVEAFLDEATSGDYENLLRTACSWVTVL